MIKYKKCLLTLLLLFICFVSYSQSISLTEISFNYEAGNANDAIAIRKDLSTNEITAPEYVTNIKNDEFAYIMGQGKPMVKVKIDGLDVNKNYSIKACVTSGNGFSNVSEFLAAGCGVSTNIFYFELENEVPNSVGKYTFTWQWEIITYPISSPYCTSTYTKTTTHTCYVIYDTPKDPEPIPRTTILNYACEWASGKSNEDDICNDILNNGFAEHYYYDNSTDCDDFSSDFVRLVSSLGIISNMHRWRGNSTYNNYDINDMFSLTSIPIILIGHIDEDAQTWFFHQWVETGDVTTRAQRDPSTAFSFYGINGTWGEYEDYLFDSYSYTTTASPNSRILAYQDNHTGQSYNCEAPGHRFYDSGTFYDWYGPIPY